jgi:single-strand DNA-binding protein
MLNTVQLMGRLTADPELKTTPNGVSACTVSLAVEQNYLKNGQRGVDFITVVMWRKTAEFAAKNFHKGQLICLSGSLQSRSYKAKDGTNRQVLEVVADQLYFTGDKRTATPAQQYASQQAAPVQQYAPQQAAPVQQYAPQQAAPTQQYAPQQAAPVQQYAPQQTAPVQQYAPQQATPTQQYAQYVQQTAQQQPQQFGVEEVNLSDDDLPF